MFKFIKSLLSAKDAATLQVKTEINIVKNISELMVLSCSTLGELNKKLESLDLSEKDKRFVVAHFMRAYAL